MAIVCLLSQNPKTMTVYRKTILMTHLSKAMDDWGLTEMEQVVHYFPKKIERVVSLLGEKYFAPLGLKSYHAAAIRVIHTNDGITQKEIRESIPFDKSRISVIVRELIDGGFVVNTASGRSSSLHLTERGKAVLSHTLNFRDHLDEEIFSIFSKDEKEVIENYFLRLDGHLDELLKSDHDSEGGQ